jgi:hypothetical protein
MTTTQVILAGGPYDQETREIETTVGLLEILEDGLIHRYVPTAKSRSNAAVYQHDGAVSPDGGSAGTEDPRERLASPLADELNERR